MRSISFILAVYFFALVVQPCSDESFIDNCGAEQCLHIETPHSDDCGDSDDCNPLCMCSCCGIIAMVFNSDNNTLAQIPSEQLSFYNQNSPSEIAFSIWQPPKIG